MSADSLLAESVDINTERYSGAFGGVFAQQVDTMSAWICKHTNSASLMDQKRAEFPKSNLGWMVLLQAFLYCLRSMFWSFSEADDSEGSSVSLCHLVWDIFTELNPT